jgi:hypothetical protein
MSESGSALLDRTDLAASDEAAWTPLPPKTTDPLTPAELCALEMRDKRPPFVIPPKRGLLPSR